MVGLGILSGVGHARSRLARASLSALVLLGLCVFCPLPTAAQEEAGFPVRDGRFVSGGAPELLAGNWYSVYVPVTAPPAPRASAVEVSPGRGLYDAPVRVIMRCDTPGARIRFTIDGSIPTESHGSIYRGPFTSTSTKVIRAVAFAPGYEPSELVSHSFINVTDVIRQPKRPPGFPDTWGRYPETSVAGLAGKLISPDYAMDRRIAFEDPRYAGEIESDLLSIPTLSVCTTIDDMFGGSRGIYSNPTGEGVQWERPASAELIHPDGEPGFHINCGIRVAGAWSRLPDGTPKHSFSLRFKSMYGPAKLDYPLFPDSPVTRFDTLRLRGGQADSFLFFPLKAQYIHDEWGRRTQLAMGWAAPRGIFVHLYLNGLYWGLYNVTEEPTASFAASHLGGEKEHYDVIKDYHQVEDGSIDAYRRMTETLQLGHLSVRERYELLSRRLDLPQHADYTLIQIYGANRDWPYKNWRAIKHRGLDTGFQFVVWDIEHMAQLWSYSAGGSNVSTGGVDGLHGWLKQVPEYRLLFADRARKHLFNDGALAPQQALDRYSELARTIDAAVVPESARWGDGGPAERTRNENFAFWTLYWERFGEKYPQNRDDHWRPERDRLLTEFFPARTEVVLEQLCREGLYPRVTPPELNQPRGAGRLRLAMAPGEAACAGSRSDGVIYYTVNGSDPREPWTGAVASAAHEYDGPVALGQYAVVKARMRAGGEWSALTAASFGIPRVTISEIMYNPHGGSEYEFLELQNLEESEVDLSGMVTSGITYTLPPGTRVPPGEYLLLAKDARAFNDRYPDVLVDGLYDGKLANEGETVRLATRDGRTVVEVDYDDKGFWPLAADGWGRSLVLQLPERIGDPESWRASTAILGSPGGPDPDPPYSPVLVNEVLASTTASLEDAIELYNPGDDPVDVGGWFLSDDPTAPRRYRLPEPTIIPPHGYVVVYAEDFGADAESGFGLSSKGETVVLSSARPDGYLTGYMAGATYGPAAPGVSLGRYRSTVAIEMVPQIAPSFGVDDPATVEEFRRGTGAKNAGPRIGPVVISEIHYHPVAARPEFIELHALGPEAVPLHDREATNLAWRFTDGVSYEFPLGAELPGGGYGLVVGSDPETFRREYGLRPGTLIWGPFDGRLKNGGERLALSRPGLIDGEEVTYTAVDWVEYDDGDVWPSAADGEGPSLERVEVRGYGNEPRNWTALTSGGTPGRANTRPVVVFLPAIGNG